MLSHEFRTIVVHVPKTGGQSVETVFLRKLGLSWEERARLLLRPNRDPALGPPRLAHLYASEYVALGYVSPQDFARYFKFSIVRNPWARAVSQFKFAYQRANMPFAEFVDAVVAGGGRLATQRHADTQHRYLYDGDGVCLVDRILRFETLAGDFGEVSQRIFGESLPLDRTNVSPDRTDYRRFHTPALADMIGGKYRVDVETFGYSFDDG